MRQHQEQISLPQYEPQPQFTLEESARYLNIGEGDPSAYKILNEIVFSGYYTKKQILAFFDVLEKEKLTGALLVEMYERYSQNFHWLYSETIANTERFKHYLGIIKEQKNT